jgi:hypothetical protein
VGIATIAATLLCAPGAAEANIGYETGIVGGAVTRSDSSVIAYAEVQIHAMDGSGTAWTSTDADGNFTLEVPVGDYEVTAIYPDFWIPISTHVVTVTPATTSTTDFVQAVGTLSGTLLRTTGAAFPNSEVYISLPTGGGGNITVEPDGSFSALVPTGDWDLFGRYYGFPVDTAIATVTEGGTGTASLFFASGELTANIMEEGAPKEGVQLHIWEEHQFVGSCPPDAETSCEHYEPAHPLDPMGQDMCHGCTSATGRRYNCDGHDGYCWWEETFNGWTTSDADGDIAFVLPEGQFNGSIRLEVWADPAQDPQTPPGTGDYWGSFDLDQFTMTVTDQSVEARPQIAYLMGTVSGLVTLDGAPVPYAQVQFMGESAPAYATVHTDADGQYTIDLVTGDYRVEALGNGLNVTDVPISVIDGSQALDLSDTSGPGGSGSFFQGVVTRNGQPQAGVQIEVIDATPVPSSCPADLAVCEHYHEYPEGEPQPPPEEMFCDRCNDGTGSFYSCHGLECWWEELYVVHATTGPDGSWSVAAEPNPYTVRLRDYFYADPAQNPDPATENSFWAEFELATYDVTLGVDETIDLGTYAYQTGTVSGTITSCGELEMAGNANVYVDNGWGWADTGSDGVFSMEIPAGTYDATLGYPYASYPWPSAVVVTAGQTTTLDHAFASHGVVEGFVSSNGLPLEGARVELREPAPAGCDIPGASCWHQDDHMCDCEFEGRGFSCWMMDPEMPEIQECYWYDGGGNTAYTGADGRFSARVRTGLYNVTAYTPEVWDPQQDPQDPAGTGPGGGGGSFVIGTLQANAFTCQVTELGAADTPIDAIPPGGTSTVELTTDLTIELASTDGTDAGTVSFVATNEEPIDEQPAGLIEVASLYYDFSTTVAFDSATICIPYDEGSLTVPEADLKMLHYDDQLVPAQWVDVTESVDTVNDIVCGVAPHFSWYVLAQLEVTDSDGDGVDEDVDNCPNDANADQLDEDGDGVGDVCDDDVDGDGVFNAFDDCASTPVGAATDDEGCDSEQRLDARCPTGGSYKNHGQYVSCVSNETEAQVDLGLLTWTEAEALVTEAAHSSIGKKVK